MNLIIVESPSKANTIKKFLGQAYNVTASVGHIKDLPEKALGVEIENDFKPQYVPVSGKKKTIEAIRHAAREAERVFIATDPDREGEAIAAHVAEVIKPYHPQPARVLFHEITKDAVRKAIAEPGVIDQRKVDAQVARRVMDRLVGYQVSPFIWKTVAKGLSAGRVQSVALRLICEREEEIRAFVPQEYWRIRAQFSGKDLNPFWMELVTVDGRKPELPDENAANAMKARIQAASFQVSSYKISTLHSKPSAPYTTSTLQQDAARQLRLSSKKTMRIAQQLYEGIELPNGESVGLITYMRTDSTRISSEALAASREFIRETFGSEYLPPSSRVYATKGRSQDAHEAIRPTDVKRTPQMMKGSLDAAQWKLYQLIWNRFIASQMADARFEVTRLEAEGGGLVFRARNQKRIFDGYQKLYAVEIERGDVLPSLPPDFDVGYPLTLMDQEATQHFTQPPPRFTEATLIKTLDELGIGRPSTYATIVSTLFDRTYIQSEDRKLVPTPLGETVNGILVKLFPDVFEVGFTARMEEQLDKVEEGSPWVQVVRDFYDPFSRSLKKAEEKRRDVKKEVQEVSSEVCEKCGSPMIVKWSRRGQFLACSAYPKCRNARPLEAPKSTGKICPDCGGELIVKVGRYGRFLGCSNYPTCKHIERITTGVKCPMPDCGGELVERNSRKRQFYSCSNYPECKYRISKRPEPIPCPECGHPFVVAVSNTDEDGRFICPRCKAEISSRTGVETADEL